MSLPKVFGVLALSATTTTAMAGSCNAAQTPQPSADRTQQSMAHIVNPIGNSRVRLMMNGKFDYTHNKCGGKSDNEITLEIPAPASHNIILNAINNGKLGQGFAVKFNTAINPSSCYAMPRSVTVNLQNSVLRFETSAFASQEIQKKGCVFFPY